MHEVLISLLARHRELIYEVCISLRRAESPKRDQNLVNGVTLGEAGQTPNVIHFYKKVTRYWESNWALSTKNVDFCRKRGRKNGAAPHKRG